MSLDISIDVDKLSEEVSTSNHCKNNKEENVCSDEEDCEVINHEIKYQSDHKTVLPPYNEESDEFSKQTTINCLPFSVNNKPKNTLHNVCISISSSSDEDEILPPAPKFRSTARQDDKEAYKRRHAVELGEPLLSHTELPDLDSFPLIPEESNDYKCGETQLQSVKHNKIKKSMKSTVKNAAKTKSKSPMKCIHLDIDHSIVGLKDAELLLASLQSMEIDYSLTDNGISLSILWQRDVDCEVSEDGKITIVTEKCPERHMLVIFLAEDFIKIVQDFKWNLSNGNATNSLLECADHHKTQFPDKNITYAIIGVDKYFREKRNKENKKYRSIACGNNIQYDAGNSPLVSFDDVEEATVCLQIHEDIICHMVDTMKDLTNLIVAFSKAIAEAPYKKESRQNVFSWYAEGDSGRGVKVNDSNEGLLQLWLQQIQQFPLVSKEVADAIVSNYPSPQSLIQAYKACTPQEAERLLKDIVIRSGVGPLVTTRHVGPELSRKIFHFFTNEDGKMLV